MPLGSLLLINATKEETGTFPTQGGESDAILLTTQHEVRELKSTCQGWRPRPRKRLRHATSDVSSIAMVSHFYEEPP